MALPDQRVCPLNRFFLSLRKKACEACPFIKRSHEVTQKSGFYAIYPFKNSSILTKGKECYPHTLTG